MAVLPRLIYRGNTILVRIPDDFFVETGNVMPKLIWNCKGSKNSQNNAWKGRTKRQAPTPDFKVWSPLLYSTGTPCLHHYAPQCYVAGWMEEGVWGWMDTCICMAGSLCCPPWVPFYPPETMAILLVAMPQYKIKVLKMCRTASVSAWKHVRNTNSQAIPPDLL